MAEITQLPAGGNGARKAAEQPAPNVGPAAGPTAVGPTADEINRAVLTLFAITPPEAVVAHKLILKPMLLLPGAPAPPAEHLIIMRTRAVFSRPLEIRAPVAFGPNKEGA